MLSTVSDMVVVDEFASGSLQRLFEDAIETVEDVSFKESGAFCRVVELLLAATLIALKALVLASVAIASAAAAALSLADMWLDSCTALMTSPGAATPFAYPCLSCLLQSLRA